MCRQDTKAVYKTALIGAQKLELVRIKIILIVNFFKIND